MGSSADGPKATSHIIHVSGASALVLFSRSWVHDIGLRRRFARFYDIGALKHGMHRSQRSRGTRRLLRANDSIGLCSTFNEFILVSCHLTVFAGLDVGMHMSRRGN